MRISVLLPLALNQSYDYLAPDNVKIGNFVNVPLRKKQAIGVVVALHEGHNEGQIEQQKLRQIISVLDKVPQLNNDLLDFINWVGDYTMAPRGLVLKLTMSPKTIFTAKKLPKNEVPNKKIITNEPNYTKQQREAIDIIHRAIDKNSFQNILLEGITGSGKTEICFNAMMKVLEAGAQALFLLPEIALANYMVERFLAFSNVPIAIWHSGTSVAKRKKQWLDIANGNIKIVIGARSALFLPFKRLKLIVVDEEHDEGFKQTDGVIYHARDMAIVRAMLGKLPVLLSTATPCLETLNNVKQKNYQHIKLIKRVKPLAEPPEIDLIDMRTEKLKPNQWLAPQLIQAIKDGLARKEQALLFLNRRGYAPLTLCRKCGFRFACPDCTAWLAEHRSSKKLLCHHCGISQPLPLVCPQCGQSDSITACGPGIERIFENTKYIFPKARIACLSRDLPATTEERVEILEKMKNGELDILIGTQIIAKGLHFPKLTIAGVIDADLGLANADLRAAERCFQLLQQVAGRTGREQLKGRAYIQTYMPDNPVMKALAQNDKVSFIEAEKAGRKNGNWPPFGRLAAVILSSEDRALVESYASAMARKAPKIAKHILLGPAPAPIFRRAKRYRIRFLLKAAGLIALQPYLNQWLSNVPPLPNKVRRNIDIDPHSFL